MCSRFQVECSTYLLTVRLVRMIGYLSSHTHSDSSRTLKWVLLIASTCSVLQHTFLCGQSSSSGVARSDSTSSEASRELALLESLAPPSTELASSQKSDQELGGAGSSSRWANYSSECTQVILSWYSLPPPSLPLKKEDKKDSDVVQLLEVEVCCTKTLLAEWTDIEAVCCVVLGWCSAS